MSNDPNASRISGSIEGLKLLNDWAKWLITIEAAAIVLVGTAVTSEKSTVLSTPLPFVKVLATGAIVCFLISIGAAALLLLSLPEIAQTISRMPNLNVWLARDSVIGRVLGLGTQGLAILESIFFGLGLVCFSALIIAVMWLGQPPKGVEVAPSPPVTSTPPK